MIFTSFDFIIFSSVVFALYIFFPRRLNWILLLAASYFYYGYWKISYLCLLIIPTLMVYLISIELNSTETGIKKKLLFLCGLFFALAGLFIFKYTDFVRNTIYTFSDIFSFGKIHKPLNLVLPIGISFFTFKMVSYIIDVYNKRLKAEKHLGYFALYVSFFPQIFMGPIDRAKNFIPELKKKVDFDMDRIISGFQLITWGVFKKMVIADRLSFFVNEIFKHPQSQGVSLIFGAYFYAFQIYCDFSGYTDMAIGISRIFGFTSMKNFDFPYFSKNIAQFWSRWHISLSTWLRDYLFLPIAYATMRKIKSPKPLNISVEAWGYGIGMFITMFLGGLWHGASWNLVGWGMLHGFFLILSYSTKKIRKKFVKIIQLNKSPRLHKWIGILITFNMISFAWIFFRAESFDHAISYLKNIKFIIPSQGTAHLIFNSVLIIFFIGLEILYKNRERIGFINKMPRIYRIAVFALFVCFIIIFSLDITNEFIYFQF